VSTSTKYLICDCVGSAELQIIHCEGIGAPTGSVRFKGKFQEANITNKNRRLYSYDLLERERARLESVVGERRLFGELDHPADSIIHLENASHLITRLWWDNQTMMGEGEILPTPAGKILETIIRAGIPVGISSRGVGSGKTNTEGIMVIDDSFRLITFDVVADPSTTGAFVGLGEAKKPFYKHENTEKTTNKNNSQKIAETRIDSTKLEHVNPHVLIGFIKGVFEESLKN